MGNLHRFNLYGALLALPFAMAPSLAGAICNVIPAATAEYRGALGTLNRPFASPGELVGVEVNQAICDQDSAGIPSEGEESVVSIFFTPPQGFSPTQAPSHAVVLAANCDDPFMVEQIRDCNVALGGNEDIQRVYCPPANDASPTLEVRELDHGRRRLFFRMPDTDALFGREGDGMTLSGPAKIVVTRAGDPLVCSVVTTRCADLVGAGPHLVACIDELYDLDGTCERNAPENLDPFFASFTALPIPNKFAEVCSPDPEQPRPGDPCQGDGSPVEVLLTTDREGNVLIPWDFRGVVDRDDGVPIALKAKGGTTVEPFQDLGESLEIPRRGFLSSHAPEGLRLIPLFTPLADPNQPATLFGTLDAEQGVHRLARRSPKFQHCVDDPALPCFSDSKETYGCAEGGTCGEALCYPQDPDDPGDDIPCTTDAHCQEPGQECGPSLFELRDRYVDGIEPVVIMASDVGVGIPVPLDGIKETSKLFAFVVNESVAGVGDLNLDGDPGDFVVTMADRSTGESQPIDRAISRFASPPFTFPAVTAEGDFLAFLESEPHEGGLDSSSDGDALDYIVHAYQVGGTPLSLPEPAPLALSAPIINGQPLVISNGLLYFLGIEVAGNAFVPQRMSVDSAEGQANAPSFDPSVSGWSTSVAFASDATDLDLLLPDSNGVTDIFVRDRDLNWNGIWDQPGDSQTARISLSTAGAQANGASGLPSADEDARHVAFQSDADNLVAGDTNQATDIFVRQRDTDWDWVYDQPGRVMTSRISVDSSGNQAAPLVCPGPSNLGSSQPSISTSYETTYTNWLSGRFVAFQSFAANLVPDDTNGSCAGGIPVGQDVFIHDRDFDEDFIYDEAHSGSTKTVRVSVQSNGSEVAGGNSFTIGASGSRNPSISTNGRFVAFESELSLDPADDNSLIDVYLHDRDLSDDGVFDEPGDISTTLVSRALPGEISEGDSHLTHLGQFGRFVAFQSESSFLVENDTNGFSDVFVYDRDSGEIRRESVSQLGEQGNGPSTGGALFPDGRVITFKSEASNLVADDIEGLPDRFFSARTMNAIVRLGTAVPSESSRSQSNFLLDDAFSTSADLVSQDTNLIEDVYTDTINFDPMLPSPATRDINGDGDVGDVLLQVVDLGASPPTLVTLESASQVVVRGGAAAFLRPEADLTGSSRTPPVNQEDINLDGDWDDLIVHLYPGRPEGGTLPDSAQNLGLAALDLPHSLALSAKFVAAIADDHQLRLWDRSGEGTGPQTEADWLNPGAAASAVDIVDSEVDGEAKTFGAILTPESDQDGADTLIQFVDPALPGAAAVQPVLDSANVPQPAEDFVLGEMILAFRTRELAFCDEPDDSTCSSPTSCTISACDLNDDGDCCDDGMQAYQTVTGEFSSSGSSVIPCQVEACDPRTPYRVAKNTVRFLTDEADEGRDLNDDGDAEDTLVQLWNLRSQMVEVIGELASVPEGQQDQGTSIDPVENRSAEDEEIASQAFLSQGLCTEDLGTDCPCGPGEFCYEDTCRRQGGTCRVGVPEDCAPLEECLDTFTVVSAPDTDGDGVVDPIDNCPRVPNDDQADTDQDGIGDDCDDVRCGDGDVDELHEECDDGNVLDGDGCSRYCRFGGCFGDVTLDNEIDEDDAIAAANTPGCFPYSGENPDPTCDSNGDGMVNNADMLALHNALGTSCPEPVGSAAPAATGCGLGGELVFVLGPLGWLFARRRSARRCA